MGTHVPTRDEALALLLEYNSSDALVAHGKAVEGVMRYMAEKAGENPDVWGVIGLVHDLDYERWPDAHCSKVRELLESREWPEEYVRAVVSHGWGLCSDVKPESRCEKTLFAIDELTGLVTACALVRPSKSVTDLEVKSVMKKWKQPSFAAGANRDVIAQGADMLGVELTELIADVIAGMRTVANEIGL